jgi:peptide/nickel transport system permease protein
VTSLIPDPFAVAEGSSGRANVRRRRPLLVAATAWVALLALAAIFADLLPLKDPKSSDFSAIVQAPSSAHPFGTDEIGRDVLSRVLYGARVSLGVAFLAVLLGLSVGLVFGLLAGHFRGRVESAILTVSDAMLAFPPILFLMVLTGVRGLSVSNVIIGLGVIYVPTFLRLARANTLAFSEKDFVVAARVSGAGSARVMRREILPNVVLPMLAYSCVIVALLIVAEGTLSFLGLGIPPPTPSWGTMISAGRPSLATSPRLVFVPAAVLFVTVLSINVIGDDLRQRLDARGTAL